MSRLLATGSVSSIKEWLTGKEPDVAGFPHAKNFAWVEFEGERIYMKSPRQIDVVRMLAEAGPPFELFHKTILEKLKTPDSALRDTFRNSKLWNRLIISDPRRRTVRLALPPAPE